MVCFSLSDSKELPNGYVQDYDIKGCHHTLRSEKVREHAKRYLKMPLPSSAKHPHCGMLAKPHIEVANLLLLQVDANDCDGTSASCKERVEV